MSDLRKKEKEERAAKRDQIKKEFVALLKEKSDLVDRYAMIMTNDKISEIPFFFSIVLTERERAISWQFFSFMAIPGLEIGYFEKKLKVKKT